MINKISKKQAQWELTAEDATPLDQNKAQFWFHFIKVKIMRVFCLFADKNDEIELNKRAFLKKISLIPALMNVHTPKMQWNNWHSGNDKNLQQTSWPKKCATGGWNYTGTNNALLPC